MIINYGFKYMHFIKGDKCHICLVSKMNGCGVLPREGGFRRKRGIPVHNLTILIQKCIKWTKFSNKGGVPTSGSPLNVEISMFSGSYFSHKNYLFLVLMSVVVL